MPEWPLSRANPRELAMWAEEWRRPQAIMWEANGQVREVAFYVRAMRDAEKPGAPSNARTLVRQFFDDLGISIPGMRRHRWIIDDAPATASVGSTDDADRSDTKARLRSIAGGVAS